ncbi:solute carrier family 28 member 3 [Drosophila hydei]|uniref:Sodium/nucleoside cotransporter n=1 Tax=Drosophila hydei TaxID=7224 RepID=A0A6J1LT71_DROHY|nr:solute carrier family 28 member 3 [Drosophila hydei]XP_023168348.1 solute carrier family 28 member 3 [Drosophila hydei]XP_023168349.1 solute carrier family 28 member 3 [Drosophila hydei]
MSDKNSMAATNNAYEVDHTDRAIANPEFNKTDYQLDYTHDHEHNANSNEVQENKKIKIWIKRGLHLILQIAIVGYFAYATYHYHDLNTYACNYDGTLPLCGIRFCTGYGMLLLLLGFIYLALFYYLIFKPKLGLFLHKNYLQPAAVKWHDFLRTRVVSIACIAILLLLLAIYLVFETKDNPQKLVSLVAPCFFILCGYVFSTKRSAIKWRIVITGITCQFLLGIICIRWEVGRQIFECLGNKVSTFLDYAKDGARFVFGDFLVEADVFAFAILPVIFFFSFFISVLYYLGAMQWIVIKLGWILQQIMGTTVCESVTAAANIFLGMSESPLLIRPYISKLTESEIHTIMVSGFATVSGTVLAAYLSFGASAAHLITSSVMAAPAALAISKLYMPETEESQTSSDTIQLEKSESASLLDAASSGASNAVPIILGIIANIVAFVAFIAFLNGLVSWLGFLVGHEEVDFEWIFSKIFIPLAWAMGVPKDDCDNIAKVVATKTIINEFVAYERLGALIRANEISSRSAGIATFAICGFANPSSLGILVGSLSAMAPNRRGTIAAVAIRAFIVGSIVCFISASFAGIVIPDEDENTVYNKVMAKLGQQNVTTV